MNVEPFYTASAQMFFTLLGCWWVVVQFKHNTWSRIPTYRRMSYVISLHFLLPGLMSVIAILSTEPTTAFLWRIAFVLASILGLIAAALVAFPASHPNETRSLRLVRYGQMAAMVLYGFVALFAIIPLADILKEMGLTFPALLIEAVLTALLALLGGTLAWILLMEPYE